MRFLDREALRVVLLNTMQHLIKVVTVSQGTVNESLAHPRDPKLSSPNCYTILIQNDGMSLNCQSSP
jgi:hypothetical protein